jgi:hypothetical protein
MRRYQFKGFHWRRDDAHMHQQIDSSDQHTIEIAAFTLFVNNGSVDAVKGQTWKWWRLPFKSLYVANRCVHITRTLQMIAHTSFKSTTRDSSGARRFTLRRRRRRWRHCLRVYTSFSYLLVESLRFDTVYSSISIQRVPLTTRRRLNSSTHRFRASVHALNCICNVFCQQRKRRRCERSNMKMMMRLSFKSL